MEQAMVKVAWRQFKKTKSLTMIKLLKCVLSVFSMGYECSCSNVLHYHLKVAEVSTEESTGSSSISGDVDMSEAGSSESTHSQLP